MSAISSIEWTDRTWNPVRGCSIISPGCVNCYAMKQAHRFSWPTVLSNPHTGEVEKEGGPYEGLTKLTSAGPQWTGQIRTVESALLEPLSWRKPARVFVNSMSDLFHEGVSDEFIDRVFATMALARQHTFQILTKRPDRMLAYLRRAGDYASPDWCDRWDVARKQLRHDLAVRGDRRRGESSPPDWRSEYVGMVMANQPWPLLNVWLGVSVEDQKRADERIPLLLQTPAAVRFISAEPLLGPVDFNFCKAWNPHDNDHYLEGIHWVIVGGESGHSARPFDITWARSIVEQCHRAGVACFVKQLGADVRTEDGDDCRSEDVRDRPVIQLRHNKGGDPSEWPEDVRVRQMPYTSAEAR